MCLLTTYMCSCGVASNDISRVKIDGMTTINTIYLYEFKDAAIDSIFESTTSEETPTMTGYVYSSEKLNKGDVIRVWQDFKFGEKDSSWTDTREYGADAIVEEKIDTLKVKVSVKADTYVITYYTIEDSLGLSKTTVTDRADVKKATKHKIQVTKDKVVIEYNI